MTYYYDIELDFEQDFDAFLLNRMYPPGYRKESLMKKLTLEHADAISTAKLNLIRLTERDTAPRFKAEIEKRINRLSEVYWWVLNTIYHPELPYNESAITQGDEPEEGPKDDGTAAKQN